LASVSRADLKFKSKQLLHSKLLSFNLVSHNIYEDYIHQYSKMLFTLKTKCLYFVWVGKRVNTMIIRSKLFNQFIPAAPYISTLISSFIFDTLFSYYFLPHHSRVKCTLSFERESGLFFLGDGGGRWKNNIFVVVSTRNEIVWNIPCQKRITQCYYDYVVLLLYYCMTLKKHPWTKYY
jgi:hypothetical protein